MHSFLISSYIVCRLVYAICVYLARNTTYLQLPPRTSQTDHFVHFIRARCTQCKRANFIPMRCSIKPGELKLSEFHPHQVFDPNGLMHRLNTIIRISYPIKADKCHPWKCTRYYHDLINTKTYANEKLSEQLQN